MLQLKRQLVIFAALAASFLLGTFVAELAVYTTRATNHTAGAPAAEVPAHSVVSSNIESMPSTLPEP